MFSEFVLYIFLTKTERNFHWFFYIELRRKWFRFGANLVVFLSVGHSTDIQFCARFLFVLPTCVLSQFFFFVIHSGKPLACGCWIVFAWHASQIYQKASWVWYLCVEDSKELSVSDIISVGIPLFSPCFTSSCSFPLSVNFGTLQMRWKHHICSNIIIVMHGWFWFDEFSMVDRTGSTTKSVKSN